MEEEEGEGPMEAVPIEEVAEEEKEEWKEEKSGERRRRSGRRSTRGTTVEEEEEELPLSARSDRRSSGRRNRSASEQAAEEREEEAKEDNHDTHDIVDMAEQELESKYEADADESAALDAHPDEEPNETAVDSQMNGEDESDNAAPLSPFLPSSHSPVKPKKAKGPKGKSRRETTRLVDEAKRLHIVNEADEEPGMGRRRRPQRTRIEPLKFWENEHVTYTRGADGLSNVMPVPKEVVRAAPSPVKRKRPTTNRRPSAPKRKTTKAKVNNQ